MRKCLLGFALGLLVVSSDANATLPTVTLDFTELSPRPVDGVSISGVTFDFKLGGLDSSDATYGGGGPGSITWVQDPSLEGDVGGILTLDFSSPTPLLQFGVAMNLLSPVPAGVSVSLFDSALLPIGVSSLNLSPIISFAEGQFTYDGAPVKRAVIDFNEAAAQRFALDNLAFAPIVPEPSTAVIIGAGLLVSVLLRRRSFLG